MTLNVRTYVRTPSRRTLDNAVRIAEGGSKGGVRFARIRPYAKLQTTVYPLRSTPIRPKLRHNPFQTIPNKLFVGHTKIWSANIFEKIGISGASTAPKRSENDLERSGIIRKHSESTWNVRKSPKITGNHEKIMQNLYENIGKLSKNHPWMIIHG